ncbi:tRNA dihydrouridine synthase DusB [Caenorhabditis elegans]|uniref:tRNA dihydrouridine synthase DusB n=1 Tax=Caenorhabditis elegans TaxID=6239 RepID=A0A168HAP7_CAEEL|nr:tRNA dihydrouridine synthase DusB [Caenorhabditis elegans]SAP35606.1 tRNA dihydrouridine synthase DusB [Caenorhabditis elegans]|eukprot:NP_001317844.1 Uncharacterized protein CELE_Y39H10B.2 [Caenorhabditis elegans]
MKKESVIMEPMIPGMLSLCKDRVFEIFLENISKFRNKYIY